MKTSRCDQCGGVIACCTQAPLSATQPFRCISVFKLQCMLCRDTQHATHARLGGIISCPSRSYTIKLNVGSISQRFLHNIGTGRQEHVKMRGSRKRRVRAQSWQRKLVQIRALPEDPLKICGVERVSHDHVSQTLGRRLRQSHRIVEQTELRPRSMFQVPIWRKRSICGVAILLVSNPCP